MHDLATIRSRYHAAHARLEPGDGEPEEERGDGGGLVDAVEREGLSRLAGSLAIGDHLVLQDEGVELELRREGHEATVRVSWADGPSYEQRIPIQGPTSSTAPPASSSAPRVTPDAASRVEGPALVAALHDPTRALYVTHSGVFGRGSFGTGEALVATIPLITVESLGSPSFRRTHGVRAAYVAGAMAGGIASPELVIAMSRAGLIGFYGAGGLPLDQVGEAVARIKQELGDAPAGFNLLHNPAEPAVEEATVDLYLGLGARTVSASAYMDLTRAVVRFSMHEIHEEDGRIVRPNRVLAKVSRPEVAERFMRPPPKRLLDELVESGVLSRAQAVLAARVPVAEDVTAEADSGGHTDRRPLVVLLPVFQRLRDRIAADEGYHERGIELRIGAAGGLGDPASVHAAFALGADYVLTGSVNQSSIEAGTSRVVKEMLAEAGMADVAQGPAPDMFELGAHVQVLGRGSMYAQRAGRLYELYKAYPSLDDIPTTDRRKVEKQILQRSFGEVWDDTAAYWAARDPRELEKAEQNPRHKMALLFRWYLGMTSRWARVGDPDRKRDYQVWCGPAMGLFNDWVAGTWLAELDSRGVVVIADALLQGAAALRRVEVARAAGVALPHGASRVEPWRRG